MNTVAQRLMQAQGQSSTTTLTAPSPALNNLTLFKLVENFKLILDEVDKIIVRVDQGNGMAPLTRRISILRKRQANTHLFAFFLAVHTRRGANWRLYSNQSNELQQEYRNAADFFGISMSAGDKGVTSQVIANAFADVIQAYRKDNPLMVGNISVPTSIGIDARYQWVGSLGSMWLPDEDKNPIDAWLRKTTIYINFMYWYVQETGKLTGRERTPNNANTIARRVLKGCHYAWQSWSSETREAWAKGKWDIEPKSELIRYTPLDAQSIEDMIKANPNWV